MTFSLYQSLRAVPRDLIEVSQGFQLSPWQRFWRLEVPHATPSLVWNMMMSMSGGWFFIVAAEAITVGDRSLTLPGIGSYVATAIARQNLGAIGWALLAMLVVIVAYDQLLFGPSSPGPTSSVWIRRPARRVRAAGCWSGCAARAWSPDCRDPCARAGTGCAPCSWISERPSPCYRNSRRAPIAGSIASGYASSRSAPPTRYGLSRCTYRGR